MCIFKALHINPKEQHKELSLEEFYSFYEVRDLKWKQVYSRILARLKPAHVHVTVE